MNTTQTPSDELTESKEENGRLRQLLINTFGKLEAAQEQVGIVETAVINSDESSERYIAGLSAMLTETMANVADEFTDELSVAI